MEISLFQHDESGYDSGSFAKTEAQMNDLSAPALDTDGAVRGTFGRLPQRLQDRLPTEFNPDVKDALDQMLEMKRHESFAGEFRKLIADYAEEHPAAVDRVNAMLAQAKEVADTPKLQQAIEVFASADGIKFLQAISIEQLTVAKVQEKLQNIDKEIQASRGNGLHEYAEELKRLKIEHEGKETQAQRDAFAAEVVDRMREAYGQASQAGIASKPGTTVAVLMVAGWLMNVAAPKAVARPSGPRVMPRER